MINGVANVSCKICQIIILVRIKPNKIIFFYDNEFSVDYHFSKDANAFVKSFAFRSKSQ